MNLIQVQRLIALETQVRAAAPIESLRVLSSDALAPTLQIVFQPSATAGQQTTAQSIVAGWDWSQAAQTTWEEAQRPNRTSLIQAATQAVQDNNAYLAIVSPTNVQVRDQVQALTQQMNRVIRRLAEI